MMEERWHRPGLVWPVILIAVGLGLLFSNLGLLHVNWWELWRLWPLILVLIGLDILSRHSRWATAAVALLTVALLGGLFYLLAAMPQALSPFLAARPGKVVVHPVTEDLAGARQVSVAIHMGLGDLRLSALGDSTHFFEGNLNYPQAWGAAPYVSYKVNGDQGRLVLESRGGAGWVFPFSDNPSGESWAIRLSPQVPLDIDVDAGASSSLLDLSRLRVTGLRVKAGVGRMEVLFPAEGERITARVEGGVGELVLRVPESMAAQVRVDGGLGGTQFSERFRKIDDHTYETAGFASAANRLEVRVQGGVGSLRVQ